MKFRYRSYQEIRDSSNSAIQKLENEVDSVSNTDFEYIIGQRLGSTSSKEQYAYIYRANIVKPIDSYTYSDSVGFFHRTPFIEKFKTNKGNFESVLITIHTNPDEAKKKSMLFTM